LKVFDELHPDGSGVLCPYLDEPALLLRSLLFLLFTLCSMAAIPPVLVFPP
jgi:hypothetical protein